MVETKTNTKEAAITGSNKVIKTAVTASKPETKAAISGSNEVIKAAVIDANAALKKRNYQATRERIAKNAE